MRMAVTQVYVRLPFIVLISYYTKDETKTRGKMESLKIELSYIYIKGFLIFLSFKKKEKYTW